MANSIRKSRLVSPARHAAEIVMPVGIWSARGQELRRGAHENSSGIKYQGLHHVRQIDNGMDEAMYRKPLAGLNRRRILDNTGDIRPRTLGKFMARIFRIRSWKRSFHKNAEKNVRSVLRGKAREALN